MMKLVLMGTGPFAVPSFETIRQSGHEIVHVFTRPELTSSSKKGPPPSPVRLWANEKGLPTSSPDSANSADTLQRLKNFNADLFVVCDYGQILSNECLKTAVLGGINLHGSLLPRHRGAAPVQWSILSGDSLAGVSVIHMTPGLDAGPVLTTDSCPILPNENAAELEAKLSRLGADTTMRALEQLSSFRSQADVSFGITQDKSKATKAPRLSKSDALILPDIPVRLLDRQIRGLQPWPGAYFLVSMPGSQELRVIVHGATPIHRSVLQNAERFDETEVADLLFGDRLLDLTAGLELNEMDLALRAADGLLFLQSVQPAGKRAMKGSEFVRGYAKLERLTINSPSDNPLFERMKQAESQ